KPVRYCRPAGTRCLKRRSEYRQIHLAWKTGIAEIASGAAVRVCGPKDCQVILRIPEFFEKAVLEDVHLVDLFTEPSIDGAVPNVRDLKHAVFDYLTLNTE